MARAEEADHVVVSADLQQVQQAEQKLLQALDVAAAAIEQLSSVGRSDRAAVSRLCTEFLQLVKESHATAKPLARKYGAGLPFEYSCYAERAQAELSRTKAQALQRRLDRVLVALPPAAAADGGGAHMEGNAAQPMDAEQGGA